MLDITVEHGVTGDLISQNIITTMKHSCLISAAVGHSPVPESLYVIQPELSMSCRNCAAVAVDVRHNGIQRLQVGGGPLSLRPKGVGGDLTAPTNEFVGL